ncbi:MAG: hypothetical protein JWO94_542 [Verrucomicrobiaceae bacterium]|nr:hypothetical protein [Verrucomicrobiaceae bacterium]
MNPISRSLLTFTALLSLVFMAQADAAPAEAQIEALVARSLVSMGDTSRLAQAFARAEHGGKFVVGVIGGSITQGAKATAPEHRYPNLVAQWWREAFPTAEVSLVNAGIGATGSNYGALRVQRDLLAVRPDFVIVEYACNDGDSPVCAETLEGLVRQILRQPQAPAVMILFMTKRTGGNTQEQHARIGAYYHLPMVSFRDGLWPKVKAGELSMDDFLADEVHPNDFGHGVAARCVTHLLKAARSAPSTNDRTDPLPAPLTTDAYEHTALQEAADLKPVAGHGWTFRPDLKAWHAEKPGSTLELSVKGRSILFMSHVIRGAMGRARVQVDEQPAKVIDGWFSGTWGGYRSTTVVAEGLAPEATHRIKIELLEEKNPESTGHGFSLYGLGEAGVP